MLILCTLALCVMLCVRYEFNCYKFRIIYSLIYTCHIFFFYLCVKLSIIPEQYIFGIMSRMHSFVDFIGRHKYGFTIFFIILIVGLLDDNSWYNRYRRLQNIDRLRIEMQSYKDQYDNDTKELERLKQHDYVEKFARERYLMKRENEDVFVVTHRPDSTSYFQ